MQTCDRTQEVTGISRSHQCKLEQWNPKPIYRITPHITCHSVAPDTSITLFKCITTRCTHHRLHTRATDLEEQVQFDITNTLLLHFSKSTSLVHNKKAVHIVSYMSVHEKLNRHYQIQQCIHSGLPWRKILDSIWTICGTYWIDTKCQSIEIITRVTSYLLYFFKICFLYLFNSISTAFRKDSTDDGSHFQNSKDWWYKILGTHLLHLRNTKELKSLHNIMLAYSMFNYLLNCYVPP